MRPDTAKLNEYFAEDPVRFKALDLKKLPAHVGIIMDGNGRWAKACGLSRSEGHAAGVAALREIITCGVYLGLDVLSVYAFSTENWKRPAAEVNFLMDLFAKTLVNELPLFEQENVSLKLIGDLDALPAKTREIFEEGLAQTSGNDGMTLMLAVNYGSRAEIVRAARALIAEGVSSQEIDEQAFSSHLYTAGYPDPELIIRTSGEMRLSNFMLYQLAYAEFYLTETYWPDFDRWGLLDALLAFQGRERRFGGVRV